MNCYRIELTVYVEYDGSDGKCHYMDPACRRWTAHTTLGAIAYAWADSEGDALALLKGVDFDPDGYNYIVTGYEATGVSVECSDDDMTEAGAELEYIDKID